MKMDNIIIHTLKDLKNVMNELQKIHNTLGTEDDNYYNIELIIVFVKLIYCKLRNSIIKDENLRKILQNNSS
jgi:hypothetical protein